MKEILNEMKIIKKLLQLNKQVINLEEFCLYAGISKHQAYHLTSNNKIKFYRPFGKLIFFDIDEVIEFLKQNPVTDKHNSNKQALNFLNKKHI